MDNSDSGRTFWGYHYREIAGEMRDLIPLVNQPRTKKQLRLLAVKYEQLAETLEKTPKLGLLKRQTG